MRQEITIYVYAHYSKGQFASYHATTTAGMEREYPGEWVLIAKQSVIFAHVTENDVTEVVEGLKAKARLMQATFEAAHREVLDQINRLLAIENSPS